MKKLLLLLTLIATAIGGWAQDHVVNTSTTWTVTSGDKKGTVSDGTNTSQGKGWCGGLYISSDVNSAGYLKVAQGSADQVYFYIPSNTSGTLVVTYECANTSSATFSVKLGDTQVYSYATSSKDQVTSEPITVNNTTSSNAKVEFIATTKDYWIRKIEWTTGETPSPTEPVDPTIEFKNGTYYIGDPAFDLSSLFSSNSSGDVTYTIKQANETGAAIDGTSFTATTEGSAIVTATQAAVDGVYNAKSVDATITVSVKPQETTITFNNSQPVYNPADASEKFYLVSGNYSSDRKAVKIETSTLLSLTLPVTSTVTLNFSSTNSKIKIDGNSMTCSNASPEFVLTAGSHTIEKENGTNQLNSIIIKPGGENPIQTNALVDKVENVFSDFTGTVKLNRTFDTDGYYSLCLPFALSEEQTAAVFSRVAEYSSKDSETYHFSTVTSIEAGKPYIVTVSEKKTNPVFSNVTISGTVTPTGTDFVGVLNPTSISADCCVIGSGTSINPVSQAGTINGFRAYFQPQASGIRMRYFSVDNFVPTGIDKIDTDVAGSHSAVGYNIAGQRVKANTKGLVIIGGKKFVNLYK